VAADNELVVDFEAGRAGAADGGVVMAELQEDCGFALVIAVLVKMGRSAGDLIGGKEEVDVEEIAGGWVGIDGG